MIANPRALPWALVVAVSTACDPGVMTRDEALEALSEAEQSSRGEAVVQEPIEISTEFTIGDAVERAAETIAEWWETQAGCTTVTVSGPSVSVDFHDLDDPCEFRGYHYGGVAVVTVQGTEPGELVVDHEWLGLYNEDTSVDGGATVTWSGSDLTRHVVTEHTWTDRATGRQVDVEGDHVFGYLDESQRLWGGLTLEGTRDWHADSGDWSLDMIDLEIRLQDPVPQAGTFDLTNPDGKQLTMDFVRIDDRTIRVTLTGTLRPLVFDINQLGIPSEVEEG